MLLKELRYIVAIADEKSVTKASQRLFISQSALSQFLSEYEEQLGYPLFQRIPQGVTETAEGIVFVKMARDLLERFDSTVSVGREKGSGPDRTIRVGIAEQRAIVLSPMLLPRFSQMEPDVSLQIIDGRGAELRRMVKDQELDLALCAAIKSGDFNGNGIKVKKMRSEEFMVVIPKGHALARKLHQDPETGRKWIDIRSLRNEDCVMINEKRTMRMFIDMLLSKNNIHMNILQTSTNVSTILHLAESLNALAFIPQGMISDWQSMHYASIGKNGKYWSLQVVMPESRELTREENVLIQVLAECISVVCR